MTNPPARLVVDPDGIAALVARLATEIRQADDDLVLLGIPTRGVPLARRLAEAIEADGGSVRLGVLDVTMYRDDLRAHPTRAVGRTLIPGSIDGASVVLVDDVLYSGRTIAAALDALHDLGRPRVVRLVVLVDRGHRELPISPDQVGVTVPTAPDEHVRVRLREIDGEDAIAITKKDGR